VSQEARAKIRNALTPGIGEPFLTIRQVAKLFYSVRRDGQPAKARRFRPRKTLEYELVPGYDSAKEILSRMCATQRRVKDRQTGQIHTVALHPELRRFPPPEQSYPNLYALPGTRERLDRHRLYGHEMDCADAFVALKLAAGPRLVRWQRYNDLEADLKRVYDKFRVKPDRIFELEGVNQVFHLEVDRGTEENLDRQVKPKIDNYIRLSEAHPGQGLTVVFTAQAYRYDKEDEERAREIYDLLARYRRHNQFLVAIHDTFIARPLEAVFNSPFKHGVSILSL
jgi:hypothetical protein